MKTLARLLIVVIGVQIIITILSTIFHFIATTWFDVIETLIENGVWFVLILSFVCGAGYMVISTILRKNPEYIRESILYNLLIVLKLYCGKLFPFTQR